MKLVPIGFLSLVACWAGPTLACMNDSETPRLEREFRSQYRPEVAPRPTHPDASSEIEFKREVAGPGVAMIVGSFGLVAFSRRKAK